MKSTSFSGLALAAMAVAVTIPRRSTNQTSGITEPYARRMAESWIVNNHETQRDRWYGRAAIYTGYESVIARTGSDELLDWYRSRIDGLVVAENGTIPTFDETRYRLERRSTRLRQILSVVCWTATHAPRLEGSGTARRLTKTKCGWTAFSWRIPFMLTGLAFLMLITLLLGVRLLRSRTHNLLSAVTNNPHR
jgi:hypothetical protein